MAIIGTLRAEEARVWDSEEGYHSLTGYPGTSIEVFWGPNYDLEPGWHWWACYPGCLPDSEPSGPFGRSWEARQDADEDWDMPI